MTPTSGFGDDARLKERREFRKVFETGKKTVGRSVILWHRVDADEREPRLGLSVSAKVGNAVRRNRLKRLLRETFRSRRSELRPGAEMVAYPRPACPWKGRADAEADLLDLWRKAGLLR
ncbi:MAG: ribonuclease P protein component [Elusimicrobiota bacterium]|nr:MAG: ribonuclease P protein component [Elusimicrobiota bacterium]